MAHRIRLRPRARADMLDIWKYVAAENERAAEKIIARINDVFLLLASEPEAGRRRSELSEGLRSFPAGSYVVFYEVREKTVDIVRVVSGYRDITGDLMNE
ncbi:type II toxin-antitoxin system RelE/ParE family toxin [Allomesorhizobium camelthorni]|uniref:Toxin n=1 Tax=Allomesorhizobium camelthorni TaxID=475069 RepID=A0A6G4WFJ0_9HYPH|nr:type II toxin-antitoxin system RelE/ParE family toxin [Mesorhizobium camelthorni]NGO53521.1 type II toxin-antitoxin system RelE/ParE family toxin [Mesorhizobium camelthorni]